MVVQMGEGDHTWTETYAVEREVYDKIQEAEKNWRRQTKPTPKPKVKSTDEDDEVPTIDDFDINEDELETETQSFSEEELNRYVDDEDDYSRDEYSEDED